ncbi:MAG: nuclear transport factor 2 family protein, partial [Stellaceae bacterium]
AIFRIAGASRHASPIAIGAAGIDEIRQWLSLLLKTFQLDDRSTRMLLIDPPRAAVHWQAKVYSRITGLTVPTELVDLVEVRGGAIASYTEFLMPR